MRNRYIILEGPDLGGKSTLAAQLADKGFAVVHTGPPTGLPPYEQYLRMLMNAETRVRTGMDLRPTVFDRFHLGERVYGPVLRDCDRLGPIYHRMLDRILLGFDAALVYCCTDKAKMVADWEVRAAAGKELITDKSRYMKLFELYDERLTEQELYTYRYDYANDSVRHLLADVESYDNWNVGPGIGQWQPGSATLLVGEQIARPHMTMVDWPFTGVSASSVWLTQQLIDWNVKESGLYWVNAIRPDGSELNDDFIEKLEPRKIIALGEKAATWCVRNGYAAVEVPHPQYWKRFHYGKPYPLKEHLT